MNVFWKTFRRNGLNKLSISNTNQKKTYIDFTNKLVCLITKLCIKFYFITNDLGNAADSSCLLIPNTLQSLHLKFEFWIYKILKCSLQIATNWLHNSRIGAQHNFKSWCTFNIFGCLDDLP